MANQSSGRPGENKRRSNMSLPDRTIPLEDLSAKVRRNTITEGNVAKVRKKSKAPLTPTIHEDDTSETDQNPVFSVENETRKIARKISSGSRISSATGCDNKAYEGSLKRNGSTTTSVRSGSLEIIQEQYCCCTRRTKCEQTLLVTVTVLVVIIVVLLIVVVVLAKNNKLHNLLNLQNI